METKDKIQHNPDKMEIIKVKEQREKIIKEQRTVKK